MIKKKSSNDRGFSGSSSSLSNKPKKLTNREIQEALIENFVNLQKVLTNLSFKFESLSDNISRLLQILEISAKSFVKKTEEGVYTDTDKDLLKKLDIMLEQNKTVAKGITLIEEKIRHKLYGEYNERENTLHYSQNSQTLGEKPKPKPLPRI